MHALNNLHKYLCRYGRYLQHSYYLIPSIYLPTQPFHFFSVHRPSSIASIIDRRPLSISLLPKRFRHKTMPMLQGDTLQERSKGKDVRVSNIVAAKVRANWFGRWLWSWLILNCRLFRYRIVRTIIYIFILGIMDKWDVAVCSIISSCWDMPHQLTKRERYWRRSTFSFCNHSATFSLRLLRELQNHIWNFSINRRS